MVIEICLTMVVLALFALFPLVLSGRIAQNEEDMHGVDKARRS